MDVDHNGVIDRDEFVRGCQLLNESLSHSKPELQTGGRDIDGCDLFDVSTVHLSLVDALVPWPQMTFRVSPQMTFRVSRR